MAVLAVLLLLMAAAVGAYSIGAGAYIIIDGVKKFRTMRHTVQAEAVVFGVIFFPLAAAAFITIGFGMLVFVCRVVAKIAA